MISNLDRRIARVLVGRRRAGSMRIAIVGNCQAAGVADAATILKPGATVDMFPILSRSLATIGHLAAALATYDVVLSSNFPSGAIRGGGSDALRQALPSIVPYPIITFTGFHPDFVAIGEPGRPTMGPMGPFHSAITLFAYRAGLSMDEAEYLFDPDLFALLGYLDLWKASQSELIAHGRMIGVDLSRDILRWMRRGCFMHNGIHPKAFVLFDVARDALSRAGVVLPDIDVDTYAVDRLATDYICPLYPPIAQGLSLRGAYLFKRSSRGRRRAPFIELRQFIAESYAAYRGLPSRRLRNDRVEAWLDDSRAFQTMTAITRAARAA